MSIVGLPNEILDQIFDLVDWNPALDLFPCKLDVISASLSCKQLRKALLPRVFRDVTLRLRWAGPGSLVEPSLMRLLSQQPALADHVRCIYVKSSYDSWRHDDSTPLLNLPLSISNWQRQQVEHPVSPAHQHRLASAARQWESAWGGEQDQLMRSPADIIAAIIIKNLQDKRPNAREELEALAICILGVPEKTHTLLFNAFPDSDTSNSRHRFSLCVAATLASLMKDQITTFTVGTTFPMGTTDWSLRHGMIGERRASSDVGIFGSNYFSTASLKTLNIKRLALSMDDKVTNRRNAGLFLHGLDRWKTLSSTVLELDLRFIHADSRDFIQFVTAFNHLETLRLDAIQLQLDQTHGPVNEALKARVWLSFAIELRRAMPQVVVRYRRLYGATVDTELSEDACAWIFHALPPGALVDADRQERLITDFDSFGALWQAESGPRGAEARADWASTGGHGNLCDMAMMSRWR